MLKKRTSGEEKCMGRLSGATSLGGKSGKIKKIKIKKKFRDCVRMI